MHRLALSQWHVPSLMFAADWLRSSPHWMVRIIGRMAFPMAQLAMMIQFRARPFSVRSFIHVQDNSLPMFTEGPPAGESQDSERETGGDLVDCTLDDDDAHAIPAVYVFDNVLTFDGGGAYLGIVIALPLDSSPRSLQRFAEKQRFYLESFFSEYGQREWGTPREEKMKIYVRMHPDSSIAAFESLDLFSQAAHTRGVQVIISRSS